MSAPFDRPLLGEALSGLGRDYAVSPQAGDEERVVESALRPHSLADFIGQPKVARQLDLVLEGAKRRGRPPDHVLLSGPPGLGKTSLALIIGSELGTAVKITSGPAIDRFGFVGQMEFYEPAELQQVLARSAALLGVELTADGSAEIAGRSRGTPRIANRLLRRVRDYAEVRADGRVTRAVAEAALALYDVDHLGLDRLDRAVLEALVMRFAGGPVRVAALAVGGGGGPPTPH